MPMTILHVTGGDMVVRRRLPVVIAHWGRDEQGKYVIVRKELREVEVEVDFVALAADLGEACLNNRTHKATRVSGAIVCRPAFDVPVVEVPVRHLGETK